MPFSWRYWAAGSATSGPLKNIHRPDPMHDVPIFDLNGLVQPEHVQDGLGHRLGGPVLGAQRPIMKRHRPGHFLWVSGYMSPVSV